jgi:hypothetical protein
MREVVQTVRDAAAQAINRELESFTTRRTPHGGTARDDGKSRSGDCARP